MDTKLEMLRQVPLFANLKTKGLEEVARLADEVDVAAGTTLAREGQSGGEFFVILDGTVAIDRGGKRLKSLGRGDFLGEIALVDGGPRTATATTESPARILVIGHREFHTLLEDFTDIRIEILECLARRIRSLDTDRPD